MARVQDDTHAIAKTSLAIQLEGLPSCIGFEAPILAAGAEGFVTKPIPLTLEGRAQLEDLEVGAFLVLVHGKMDGFDFTVKDSVFLRLGVELQHTVQVPNWDLVPFEIQVTDHGVPLAGANIVQSGLPHNMRFRIGATDAALIGIAGLVNDELLQEFDVAVWRTGQKKASSRSFSASLWTTSSRVRWPQRPARSGAAERSRWEVWPRALTSCA